MDRRGGSVYCLPGLRGRLTLGSSKKKEKIQLKIKAAISLEPQKPLVIDEIDLEGPKEGECLVRLAATGVCHTDAYTHSGADPEGLFPAVLGHEGAGVVEEVGPGVRSLKPGNPRNPTFWNKLDPKLADIG